MNHPILKLILLFILAAAATTLYLVYTSEQDTISREQQALIPVEEPAVPETPPTSNATVPDSFENNNATALPYVPDPPLEDGEEPAPPAEDDVVTTDFLSDLASFTLAHYHPAGTEHNPGSSPILTLSVKSVNMRYGIHLFGLGHEQEGVLAARREILGYILRVPTLDLLSSLYMDRFREELELQARETTRLFTEGGKVTERKLNEEEVDTFLELVAAKADETGRVLQALTADPAPLELLQVHSDAVKRVNAAHARFWGKKDELMPLEADRAAEEIKSAILTREQVKQEYLETIRKSTTLTHLTEQEVFYLGKWVARRVEGNPGNREVMEYFGGVLRKF